MPELDEERRAGAQPRIETIKLPHKHLVNKDLKVVQSKPVKVPYGLPNLHFLQCIVGGRGQGKTTFLLNEIEAYASEKVFEKVYCFSPTLHNDPKYERLRHFASANGAKLKDNKYYDLKTYTTYADDIFREVLDEIKDDIQRWKDYEKEAALWKRYLKVKDIEDLSNEDVLALYMMDFQEPVQPFPKFPCSLLVFDDLVGNKELYRSDSKGIFNSFVILHRHLACSCIFLSQIFHNAVPRQIRTNISTWVLFKNRNSGLRKEIADELSGAISPEAFLELWDRATDGDHDAFMIDFDAKDKKFRYRKNLNELLVLKENISPQSIE